MLENWNNAIITDVILAVYVFPETGATLHTNRPSHGFVINDSKAEKIITFSDGTTGKKKTDISNSVIRKNIHEIIVKIKFSREFSRHTESSPKEYKSGNISKM